MENDTDIQPSQPAEPQSAPPAVSSRPQSVAPPWKRQKFLSWSRPRFPGAPIGLLSGLLTLGVIAGLSAVYNLYETVSLVRVSGGQWYSMVFLILFAVFGVGLLLLVGIMLPLFRTLHRGMRTILTAYIFEMIIFLVGIVVLLLLGARTDQLPAQDYYGYPSDGLCDVDDDCRAL